MPDDTSQYVHSEFNHPLSIIEQLPEFSEKEVSNHSSSEIKKNQETVTYHEDALKKI